MQDGQESNDLVRGGRQPGTVTRRQFIGRSAGAALAVGGLGSALAACGTSSKEVVVLTWGGTYLAPHVADGFQRQTGITMRAVPGASDADFITKLKAGGGSQYDVVIGNCGYAHLYAEADIIEVLDLSAFQSAAELYPQFREDMRFPYLLGRDKALCFPNLWGPYSLTFNTTVPYQPATPYRWADLFAAPKGKVLFHGPAAEEQIPIAGMAAGVPLSEVFDISGNRLHEAAQKLIGLKPYQISESDEDTANKYRHGDAYIGTAFGLGVGELINQAAGKTLARSVIPAEGAIGALDGQQLVKGARNRANAIKFIDYFGGKQNQRWLFEQLKYAPSNRETVEALLEAGGSNAEFIRAAHMDQPSVAAGLGQLKPAKRPQEWAAVFDQVQAA
jgi:spermidine/putrescine transport system substrate-binding protein